MIMSAACLRPDGLKHMASALRWPTRNPVRQGAISHLSLSIVQGCDACDDFAICRSDARSRSLAAASYARGASNNSKDQKRMLPIRKMTEKFSRDVTVRWVRGRT
jgi:hypothetical protein